MWTVESERVIRMRPGAEEGEFFRLKTPIHEVVARGAVKLVFRRTGDRWTIQHESTWVHQTFATGRHKAVPDVLAPLVEKKGLKEVYTLLREFMTRVEKFAGRDFAAEIIARLV